MEIVAVVAIVGMLALSVSSFAGEAFRLYHANWRAASIQSDLGFALTHMSDRLREATEVTIAPGGHGVSFRAWDAASGAFNTLSFALVGEAIQTGDGFVLSQHVSTASFSLDPILRTVTVSLTSVGPSGPLEAGAGLPITLTNQVTLRQPASHIATSTVTRIWTFDGNAAGWSSSTRSPAVASVTGADGHPAAGSLQGMVTGRNRGGEDNVTWEWSGSLASLGVPPNTQVVGAQVAVWWRVAEWHTGRQASWRMVLLAPAGPVTLLPERSGLAGGGWAEAPGSQHALFNLDASTAIRIQIIASLETGNASAARVTLRWDTINLRLTYVPR